MISERAMQDAYDENDQLRAEVSRLTAELASLRAQEPVAWMIQHKGLCMGFVPEQEQGTVPVFARPVPAAQIDPRFATAMYQHDLK